MTVPSFVTHRQAIAQLAISTYYLNVLATNKIVENIPLLIALDLDSD